MKVRFVGAGPGDPELLTVKAHKLLTTCAVCVYAGSLVSNEVIDLIAEDADKHDSAGMDLASIVAVFKDAKNRGVDVVRLHTGDPSIYGAIGEQMRALDKLGIDYEVVPGVSSFQAAAAAIKKELTAPEVSQTIILTRMAGKTPVPDEQSMQRLAESKSTLCIFLSVSMIGDLAEKLKVSYGPDAPVAVVYRASWPDQLIVEGTLNNIGVKVSLSGIKKTAMIIVGQAIGVGNEAVSLLYDKSFSHEYRKGA